MESELKFIKISKNRTKVMYCLQDGDVKIPTQIANETGIIRNHVSNTLKQLKGHDIVECLNPEARKGRIYRLTGKGKIIVENMDFEPQP